jgi:SAM-dependent methyltransferase
MHSAGTATAAEPLKRAAAASGETRFVASPPPPALDVMSEEARRAQRSFLSRIIASYKSAIVRNYCRVRFLIIRQDFLNEVGQYLPENGLILDIGCGFGLFGLYFAGSAPGRRLHAYDLNAKRIAMARLAAREAGVPNARFDHGDALALPLTDHYDAIYALDLVHHLPAEGVPEFLAKLYRALRPGGVLVLKDVEDRPFYKRWFTLWLDRLMVGWTEPIHYWPRADLRRMLRTAGFEVRSHSMKDILPYPHIIYACRKPA